MKERIVYHICKANISCGSAAYHIAQAIYHSPLELSPMQTWKLVLLQEGRGQAALRKCPVGSEPSAAGGRYSEVREWQRSKKSRISVRAKIFSGTATGCRN